MVLKDDPTVARRAAKRHGPTRPWAQGEHVADEVEAAEVDTERKVVLEPRL